MTIQRSIALVGLSGVGKSSVGRLLAGRLGWPLRDTDALVVQAAGCSIAHVFASEGEPRFRDHEASALKASFTNPPAVVATGGGIVLRDANRALLRERAFVVWLDAPTSTLVARLLAHDEDRPLLSGDDPATRLETLRVARASLYEAVAHTRIDVAERSVDRIAEAILQVFQAPE